MKKMNVQSNRLNGFKLLTKQYLKNIKKFIYILLHMLSLEN